jgi:hypothetical protein
MIKNKHNLMIFYFYIATNFYDCLNEQHLHEDHKIYLSKLFLYMPPVNF